MSGNCEPAFINDDPHYRQVFRDMFDGIILDEPERVVNAAHELEDLDTPYAGGYAHESAIDYRESMYEALEAGDALSKAALQNCGKQLICAYAYSGVPFEPGPPLLAAARLDIDHRNLRRSIMPYAGFLAGTGMETPSSAYIDSFIFAWRGLTALNRMRLLNSPATWHRKANLKLMDFSRRIRQRR